jgi:hypothetical protein
MWLYLGPSCPDRPFSIELGDTVINTRIRGVLAHGADLNLGSGLIPLREVVDNLWVSSLGLSFGSLCRFLFLIVCIFLHRIPGTLAAPHRMSPYLRVWRYGRPTVSIVNSCGYRGKGDETGALPGWRQGRDAGGRGAGNSL